MSNIFSFLRINRRLLSQYLMVFFSFSIIIGISLFFSSSIVQKNIALYGEKVVDVAAEAIDAYINDFVIILDNLAFSVERLHSANAGIDVIRKEITAWTEWMHFDNKNISDTIGFYGVIYDTFIDGVGWIPDSDYVPQSRPWYTGAYEKYNEICYTEPYFDASSGNYCISISRLVFDENNKPFGVVSTDIYMNVLEEYVKNMNFLGNGYGILLDSEQRFAVHPFDDFIGMHLADINGGSGGYAEMSQRLFAGEVLSAFPFISYSGVSSVAFFTRLFNSWQLSIILPSNVYFSDIQAMRIVVITTGIILALIMCGLLTYMHIRISRSDEASNVKSLFLANMSHEIRTPMNAIIGMSEFLQHEQLNSRQMDFVNDIHSSAHSLLTIINDILDMSKIEAGKLNLIPINYNFYAFLDMIKSMLMYMTERKGLKWIYETFGDIPKYVYGDDVRLKQVLINICSNAVKFTGKGGVSLHVTAREETLLFEICDSGRGISKNELPKIFNAFEQADTKENRAFIGTGLGLSISKTYVEMMGGTIAVDSILGQGSTFTVEIPLVRGGTEGIAAEDERRNVQVLSAPDANILIVDDNEFNLKTIEALLGLFNTKIKAVYSGKEAIEAVQKEKFDIVFMDHMMPEMDGVEAVSVIRKLGPQYNYLIIIALTANAIYGVREMFLLNGFNDYISKPVDLQGLKNLLFEWLPKNKIITTDQPRDKVAITQSDKKLQDMLRVLFLKNNINKFKEITAVLESGDIKHAHRLAHNLKSNAGQIGKMRLQSAAADIEYHLKEGINNVEEEKLIVLEKELNAVIEELSSVSGEMSSDVHKEYSQSNGIMLSAAELLDKLESLLKSGNPESLNYINNLRAMPDNERLVSILIQQIEDYEFDKALDSLIELKKIDV
ncbi:MAG: ATP-binding protein [Treponema sp.]|nr:ATP-binding protein [Treponema sp.]